MYRIFKAADGAGSVPSCTIYKEAMRSHNYFVVWRAFSIIMSAQTAEELRSRTYDLNVAVRNGIIYG